MKNIVITGGLGYIGMELCKLYSGNSRIDSITVIDNKFYSDRVSQIRRWGINYQQLDILDSENLEKILNNADIIYHLAGVTDVPTTILDKSKKNSGEIKRVGITGTKNIIKYSPKQSKIVFPSTHVVFEGIKKMKKGIEETYQPKPILDYSTGKYISENDLIKSSKNYVILRLGSVYGISYDSMRLNIMPNLFSKITSLNGQINLHNGGKQLKSLVNVIDVARCLKFVGENENISREIYNCSNEQLTVKQVAEICKRFNNELKIISTKDTTPNNGYSLSSKKIRNEGFDFLYNIEDSIKEMINSWKETKLENSNEIIEIGQDEYIDNRGIISNYYIDDSINMIGYVESKKHTVRGNHFHPVQTQKCLLIKGQYLSITKDLKNENSSIEIKLISEGDLSTIPPNVAHSMVFLEDSIFLNLVNGNRDHSKFGISHTIKHELLNKKYIEKLIKIYKAECRVCSNKNLKTYLSLGLSPLANNLVEKKDENIRKFPLELNYCNICNNSQLSVVIPRNEMFKKYLYLSSTTSSFKEHFSKFSKNIIKEFNLSKKSFVVDIGSNDGVFLRPLKELGIKALGVEPAKNIANIANKENLETLPGYFGPNTVTKIIKNYGKADIVTAFNVFAHNDNLKDMLNNASKVLKNNGVFIFEVQYLLRTIKDLTFDNIYHEHVNYWCVLSLLKFFNNSGLKIYKIQEVETHGGSIRVYASKNKDVKIQSSVKQFVELEKKSKLDKEETYNNFSIKIRDLKNNSIQKINNLLLENRKIIGYGAPAKATTVLNYFGINNKHFEYTIDDNFLKQNKFIPGTNIQIKNTKDINTEDYDNVVVLAWNFYDEIKRKNSKVFKNAKFLKLK